MTRFRKWIPAVLALVALAATAGCEKRPTGFDPNPNAPEGVFSPNARLLLSRNLPLRVMVRDYASTNIDSVVDGVTAFAGPVTMPLVELLDGTPANSFELYRRDAGGKFQHTSDFALQPTFKYVNAGYESYFSTDPSPGPYAPPTYLARGLVDGVATHQSPLTNEARLTQATLDPITYNGDLQPQDSLFTISWVGVPGAVGYWVHVYEKPIAAGQRLISALPGPIAYLTAGDVLIGWRDGNLPGGSVQFRLGDPSLLTLKYSPPLLGHQYIVRVSAVDATGQVFAQTPGDLDSLSLSADLAYLAPPTYSPDKTKLFFSLGGPQVARRAPPHRGPADAQALSPGPAADLTLERHNPLVRFAYPGPAPRASWAGRAGGR